MMAPRAPWPARSRQVLTWRIRRTGCGGTVTAEAVFVLGAVTDDRLGDLD